MMPGWDDFLGDLGDGDGDEDIQHGFHDVPCYTVKSIMSTICGISDRVDNHG